MLKSKKKLLAFSTAAAMHVYWIKMQDAG